MRRLPAIISTSLVLGSLAVPAAAQEPVPTFRSERAYFNCSGDVKLQNVALLNGELPSWDTTAPGSATLGNGCGMYENNLNQAGLNAEFKGTFTGNLDNLTVEMHNMGVSNDPMDNKMRLIVQLVVDDEPLAETSAADFPTVRSSTGLTEKVTYTFTELNFDDEIGDGTQVHQVYLAVRSSGTETQSAWVWDASEVPAGVTFNPATLEQTQIPVNRGG
jgi:hypothetical protein